jgi:hypothetical protein
MDADALQVSIILKNFRCGGVILTKMVFIR